MLRLKKIPSLDKAQLESLGHFTELHEFSAADRKNFDSIIRDLGIDAPVHRPTVDLLTQKDLIVRDFADPRLELIRLLKEASEIEHSLMLQYLFSASTIRADKYAGVAGAPINSPNDMLGVAIQEMRHLTEVCNFTSALGGRPNVRRQDFPFEPDIYPFELTLERCSQYSMAKYVYTEASASKIDIDSDESDDKDFIRKLNEVLETGGARPVRPNQLGSLYGTILMVMDEVVVSAPHLSALMDSWRPNINAIKDEGEDDHYAFFKSVFLGTHSGFQGTTDVWEFPEDDERYPSFPVEPNATAYEGFENTIADQESRKLAWLSNLHYWIILALMQNFYQERRNELIVRARRHMQQPLYQLSLLLSERKIGIPYDQLSLDYQMGVDLKTSIANLDLLLLEAKELEIEMETVLGPFFPTHTIDETRSTLQAILTS